MEEDSARGDVLCTAVVLLVHADGTESHLEDADAVELHLLAQLEEVFHRTTELVEDSLDVGLLHRCLRLDELGQFLGLNEVLVVDSRSEPLTEGAAAVVLILDLFEFLTHNFEKLKKLMKLKKLKEGPLSQQNTDSVISV